MPIAVTLVQGDLLDQRVCVIVNAWKRNIVAWWLLPPQAVSGAIKRRAGFEPIFELGRCGPMLLGGAVMSGAGHWPCHATVQVAGISMLWVASKVSKSSGLPDKAFQRCLICPPACCILEKLSF